MRTESNVVVRRKGSSWGSGWSVLVNGEEMAGEITAMSITFPVDASVAYVKMTLRADVDLDLPESEVQVLA